MPMHSYTIVITLMPAAIWHDILGKSFKPILYAIPNMHIVDYNKKTTFIEHCPNILQTAEAAVALCQKGYAVEKEMIIKMIYCKTDGFTNFKIPWNTEISLK